MSEIKLILGDCLVEMKKIPDKSVDLVLTDPPYSSGTRQAANRKASNIPKRGERWSKERAQITWDSSYSQFGLSLFMNTFLRLVKNKMKDGSHLYTFIDWRNYPLLTMSVEYSGLFQNNLLVWDKGVYALGGNYRSQHELILFASNGSARELNAHDLGNVLKCKRVSGGEHPTEKPKELLKTIIQYSTNQGGTILDPFMGSGTTGVACKELGRNFIGIEIEPKYYEIAQRRINNTVELML